MKDLKEQTGAYKRGVRDYQKGYGINDNPFLPITIRDQTVGLSNLLWEIGWTSERFSVVMADLQKTIRTAVKSQKRIDKE